jgi:hypothetical protein
MRHEHGDPADRRPLAALYAIAAILVGFAALAANMGPGRAFHWLASDLLPMLAILGVVVGVFGLLVRQGGKAYDEWDERHPAGFREGRRDRGRGAPPPRAREDGVGRRGGGSSDRAVEAGFSDPVYWLLVCLFLLAGAAMACFFWLVVRDQWINQEALVAGRFDHGESLRIVFALLVAVAAPSGLLWGHYRRSDSYGSPLGPFFAVAFALCGALASVVLLPAVFAG